jgi:hypothetical protein
MSLSIEDLAGQYHQAWTELNPDTIAALHTDDSTFHMHGFADPAVGRESVRDLIRKVVGLAPDLRFEPKRGFIGTDHIVLEYDMSGTFSGMPFVCDGVDVFSVVDGLMARKDTYLDLVALQDQVGTLPRVIVQS